MIEGRMAATFGKSDKFLVNWLGGSTYHEENDPCWSVSGLLLC
jgi:hypothetical protein